MIRLPPGVRAAGRWVQGRARWGLARLLMSRSRGRVVHGPFRGMVLSDSPYPGRLLRLLLGTHELELHQAIERLVAAGFRTIINCGAARGYYAVGFALRCPQAQVIAFEALADMQADIARAARANGVDTRIALRGICNPTTLQDALSNAVPPVLVFADIEGDELATFDNDVVTCLARASVLIETHDERVPGTTEQLLKRFATTHRSEVYSPRDRTRDAVPPALASRLWRALSWLVVWVMQETRPASQRWLLFTPR